MTTDDTKLSEQETWDGAHLSELALSCLADAQNVVDPVARVHAESCAECMFRIGAMALESHDVGAALAVAKQLPEHAPARSTHRFPTLLVAAAALVAIATGVPTLVDSLPRAIAWAFAAPHIVPVVTTSLITVTKSFSSVNVSLVATFALALIGFTIARLSRSRSSGVSS